MMMHSFHYLPYLLILWTEILPILVIYFLPEKWKELVEVFDRMQQCFEHEIQWRWWVVSALQEMRWNQEAVSSITLPQFSAFWHLKHCSFLLGFLCILLIFWISSCLEQWDREAGRDRTLVTDPFSLTELHVQWEPWRYSAICSGRLSYQVHVYQE